MRKIFFKLLLITTFLIISRTPVWADNATGVKMDSYVKEMQSKIYNNWHTTKDKSYFIATIFQLGKTGNVNYAKILKSSGDKCIDGFALDAIERAKPFGPLPSEFKGENMDVRFTFYSRYSPKNAAYSRVVKTDEANTLCKSLSAEKKKNYNNYLKFLEKKIDTALLPTERHFTRKKLEVSFVINNKVKKVSDIKIEKPSDSKIFDASVVTAINDCFLYLNPFTDNPDLSELKVTYKINGGMDICN